MYYHIFLPALLETVSAAQSWPSTTCPAPLPSSSSRPVGVCPTDFTLIGPDLEAVHESTQPPTGLAVDANHTLYLTYPRNTGPTPNNVAIATNFTTEEPWPNAAIQNCTEGQDLSRCFVNVQNVVLDSQGVLWVIDSGIPPGKSSAQRGGAKIMSFDPISRELKRTYVIPESLYFDGMNANDVRLNNTLGSHGYAFITDESTSGSILAINLADGDVVRRLYNTTVTRADPKFVGIYNGRPTYSWKDTRKEYTTTGADGIALASGNVYWANLGSRRFYYVSQEAIIDRGLSDEDVLAVVQDPGQVGTEQAGLTADDRGRVYVTSGEHNAIFYVDTQQAEVKEEVNGVAPGGSGPVAAENHVVKTLVRNGQIQHADSAAILDGWLYFCTNQLPLSPGRQYRNVDHRKGPFRSYRMWIGRGPAV